MRGHDSWIKISRYPYEEYRRRYSAAVVEVTVPGAVPDVLTHTVQVEHVRPSPDRSRLCGVIGA